MIARGFKPVAWVACVGVAAIGCYMVSLRVASERADLTGLERRIVQTRQQIRSLEAELGTRGRLQQLEQWNDEVLALSAPVSGQFVSPNAQLAQYSITPPAPLENAAEVQLASASAAPAPAPAQPVAVPPQRAIAPQRAPQPALGQAMVQRASLTLSPATQQTAPAPRRAPAQAAPRPRSTTTTTATPPTRTAPIRTASAEPRPSAPVRAQPAPARRAPLVDDRALRDLSAREERRGTRRN